MNTKIIASTLIVTFLVLGGMIFLRTIENTTEYPIDELENLATCLTDSGASFYGAYWCAHCQAQKRMFGSAVELLPYIECSTDDPQVQNPACEAAMITSYPTWEFADGGLLLGEVPLPQLAERAKCEFMGVTPIEDPPAQAEVNEEVVEDVVATSSEEVE